MNYHHPFIENNYYHIVSRAVGNEKLFIEPENYRFFLQRFQKYISPIADTYAYSLLPNHFHFLIKIKRTEELLPLFISAKNSNTEYNGWVADFTMQHFSNLLNSYTKSFNKKYKRKGSLFMDYLRRVPVLSDQQFTATLFYIHKNAVHHGYCKKIPDWKYCSYPALLSPAPTKLMREEVIDWFGSLEAMIEFHTQPIHLKHAGVTEL